MTRVALITGGSRGIGRAIVLELIRHGFKVGFTYRANESAAEETLAEVRALGGEAEAWRADVRDYDRAKEVVAAVREHFGGLDTLVSNAGITQTNALMLSAPEDLRETVEINLLGAIHYARAVIVPFMKQGDSCILFISSVNAERGFPGLTAYAATKAGLLGFMRSLAREAGPRGVSVNAVAPGFIETVGALPDKRRQKVLDLVPFGRFGKAEEVATLTRFLLTEGRSYITGQTFVIDGGLSI